MEATERTEQATPKLRDRSHVAIVASGDVCRSERRQDSGRRALRRLVDVVDPRDVIRVLVSGGCLGEREWVLDRNSFRGRSRRMIGAGDLEARLSTSRMNNGSVDGLGGVRLGGCCFGTPSRHLQEDRLNKRI